MEISTLDTDVARTPDLGTACQAVVASLAAAGDLGAAAYLARGGRLRCQAAAGMAHVADGVPVAQGPAGMVLRSGEQHLEETGTAWLPIFTHGRVVGVLCVSAAAALDDARIDAAHAAATTLGRRIAQLGGPPEEGAAARLAQHVSALTTLDHPERIERATLVAALDLARMESALLLRLDAGGTPVPRCAAGPSSRSLLELGPAALRALADVVRDGASCATLGAAARRPAVRAEPALAALERAGAASAAAVPLRARGEDFGVLIVVDGRPTRLSTDQVELLELVAGQAASSLRVASAVADLRQRAATDPLTGLGHRGAFDEALAVSHRRPVPTAVALCDVDRFKDLNDAAGHQRGDIALQAVGAALDGAMRRGDAVYRIGGDEFAALLAVTGEHEALLAARRMHGAIVAADPGVTVSIGVAVSGPEESDAGLLARADRALYRAKAQGRDGVVLASPAGPSIATA